MRVLFLHGWRSVPGGVKPSFLREHGHEVLNPALPDEDWEAAVRIAQQATDRDRPQVIVGSSRGGAVAMNVDPQGARLVLLCPAWHKYGPSREVPPGTIILHSRADDVVQFTFSEELVRTSPGAVLIETGFDHRLADPESLQVMLDAVESRHSGG